MATAKEMTIQRLFKLPEVALPSADYDYGMENIPCEDVILSTTAVGIEVEVENSLARGDGYGVWRVDNDGSLRNQGYEYISCPIRAKWVPQALHNLMTQVIPKDSCFGPRTSVHVHVNMHDVSPDRVQNIVLLYGCFEPLFYKFTGRGRDKNIYCVPLMDTNLYAGMLQRNLASVRGDWSKYTGLNLLPLGEHGTIEFRQMHGTFDYHKLSVWVRMITSLADYVKSSSVGSIREAVLSLNSADSAAALLFKVFGAADAMSLRLTKWEEIERAVLAVRQAFVDPEMVSKVAGQRSFESSYFTQGN